MPKNDLKVIPASPERHGLPPPEGLDEVGEALWRKVTGTYQFDDPASTETLYQACMAVQVAARCREQINSDGEMLRTKSGTRAHPLLRDELANRSFAVRCLARLGLDLEPLRSGPGRPPVLR